MKKDSYLCELGASVVKSGFFLVYGWLELVQTGMILVL
jgi:hypothetical protein